MRHHAGVNNRLIGRKGLTDKFTGSVFVLTEDAHIKDHALFFCVAAAYNFI